MQYIQKSLQMSQKSQIIFIIFICSPSSLYNYRFHSFSFSKCAYFREKGRILIE